MTIIFFLLVLVACIALGFFVLIQNPKGGGLSGSVAGISNQFMGVKQTTDVLERGTWVFAIVIGVLCLLSTMFIQGGSDNTNKVLQNVETRQSAPKAPATAPAPTPAPTTPGK